MKGLKLIYGLVSDVDPTKGLYRVNIDQEGIVSDWLPRLSQNTKNTKSEFSLDINEHVVCLMDERCENGVILGSMFNTEDLPTIGDAKKQVTTYPDGSFVEFDTDTGVITIDTTGDVVINSANNVNITATKLIVNGDVEVSGDVVAKNGGVIPISLYSHTHTSGSSGSPTSPPLP